MRRNLQRSVHAGCPSTSERSALLRSGRTGWGWTLLRSGGAVSIAFLLLAGCGLLSPPDPPAREVDITDEPVPDAPVPFAPVPDAPTPTPTPTPTPPPPPPPPGGATPPPPPPDPVPPPPPSAPPDTPPFPGYRLTWHDEFEGTELDESRWKIAEGPNRGGVTSRDAVTVRDGMLRLTTFTDAAGVHHTGIISAGDETYGYFEARLRPTEAPGNWCAFWINSPTIGNPIGDPGTAGVEIDVIEHRFENREHYDLSNMTYMNINWDGFGSAWKKDGRLTALPGNAPIQNTWHTFSVLWTETAYYFYVDGVALWRTSAAMSHRSQYVVLSCEVKNDSWAGWIPPGGYGTRETSTTGLMVDWIRVWQKE